MLNELCSRQLTFFRCARDLSLIFLSSSVARRKSPCISLDIILDPSEKKYISLVESDAKKEKEKQIDF